MMDSTQVEIKAVIDLDSIVFEKNPIKKLVDVKEEPLDMEALQESPGIIGYITRSGDRLWDIAKENYTTIDNIKETNHLTESSLKEGEKILIIKTVG
jgi:LysM repeat protein